MTDLFAHSENRYNHKHLVKEHLTEVAKQTKKYAGDTSWTQEALLAGMLHDLGKYADLFQARLRGEESGLDHWSPGAWVALTKFHAVAAALAIQGHHIGLQRGSKESLSGMNPALLANHHPLNLRLSDPDPDNLVSRAKKDNLKIKCLNRSSINMLELYQNPVASMLDVRLLFSCLTDADFLDTEAHFEGNEDGKCYRESGPVLDAREALKALDLFMKKNIRHGSNADQNVTEARNSLWKMMIKSAASPASLFTLTAPTGSGKTLAMLKFALEHAARNNMKRVVIAVPYLSIIEQTAAIYSDVFDGFPTNFVLEHHSLAGLGSEGVVGDGISAREYARRLLAENWDAPIIVTTNVQVLESLFSNRPSACRKLHNLMESVIMFDEAQTLPQVLAVHTLAALSHLSKNYKTTVMFATATQPAFDTLHEIVKKQTPSGWQPVEAAPDHLGLYGKLCRYDVSWPKPGETKSWQNLAGELKTEKQVLCVVNLKKHASDVLEELGSGECIYHLSTNLCALHRREVLSEIRKRLKQGKSCRLVSTQCIEAGVDVDFPVVFRALAPLDSIAQASGRCNREGRLVDKNGYPKKGKVRVFEPDVHGDHRKRYPTHAYFQATEVTRSMLMEAGEGGIDLNDLGVYREYYRRLYDLNKPETQNQELDEAVRRIDFVGVAKQYRLINQDTIQVLVPYLQRVDLFEELRHEQEEVGISAKWIRRAQGLTVNVYRPRRDHPAWEVLAPAKLRYGKREELSDEWFILQDLTSKLYDKILGLRLPQSQQILIG